MAKKITADTLISECLELNPNAAEILLATGMHCIGCAMAHGETIAEAVAVHGEDLESQRRRGIIVPDIYLKHHRANYLKSSV